MKTSMRHAFEQGVARSDRTGTAPARASSSATQCASTRRVVSMYLQNIDRDSLEQVFACFGITSPVVPAPRCFGYLNELVEKRRAVSHGRSGAEEAGRGYRSEELLRRLDAVLVVVAHLESKFATYISQRMYLAAVHR